MAEVALAHLVELVGGLEVQRLPLDHCAASNGCMKPSGMIQYGTMKRIVVNNNPFRYGCVVEDSFYCPRPLLEKQLAGFIRSGQNVVVQGERRMGKTSLINAVVRGMRGWRMIYVDLLHVMTVGDICRRIVSAVRNMEQKASLFEKVLKLLPRLHPVMKIDASTGEIGFGLDVRAAEDPYSVEEVLDMLAKVAAAGRTVIVFDEFQDVCNLSDAQTVLALMRGRIQFQGDIPYVFTGSVRSRMIELFDDPDSAFYKSALTLCVGEIDRSSFTAFLRGRFESGHRHISDETVGAIMDKVADVPGDVQQLCEAVWGVTSGNVKIEDIEAALQIVFMREGEKFEGFCERLSPVQFKLLAAIARLGGREIQSRAFLEEAGIGNAASARKAAFRLCELRYIYLFRGEYRFTSMFFRAWLLRRDF